MNPETLRRFYRIYPSGSYAGRILEFKFSPIDRRYPKQEFTLRYSIANRDFDAVSVNMERKGSRTPHNTIDPAPLVAALPPRMLAGLVTKSIEAEASPEPSMHYLHGVQFVQPPSIVPPVEIPAITNIKFTLKRDSAAFERLTAELLAEMKETTDATEDGHRKQAAGRQDGAHVRAAVLRCDDRSEGDR